MQRNAAYKNVYMIIIPHYLSTQWAVVSRDRFVFAFLAKRERNHFE